MLRGLEGVADAEIVDDATGAGTLRLTLVPGADEVAVAVNVNAVLRDEFGLAVDSGKVQVVEETWSGQAAAAAVAPQVMGSATAPTPDGGAAAAEAVPAPALPAAVSVPHTRTEVGVSGGRRMAIRRLQLVSTSAGISTAVSLGLGARTVVGEAEAGTTPESVQRAVALATLRAVSDILEGRAELELQHVEVAPVGEDWVAVVVAGLTPPDGATDRLTGAAVVREDVRQAVIRATLDAVNRRVEAILAVSRDGLA